MCLSGDFESIGRGHRGGSATEAEISRVLGWVFGQVGCRHPKHPKDPRGRETMSIFFDGRSRAGDGRAVFCWLGDREEREEELRQTGPYRTTGKARAMRVEPGWTTNAPAWAPAPTKGQRKPPHERPCGARATGGQTSLLWDKLAPIGLAGRPKRRSGPGPAPESSIECRERRSAARRPTSARVGSLTRPNRFFGAS